MLDGMQLEQSKRHRSSKVGAQQEPADTQGFVSNDSTSKFFLDTRSDLSVELQFFPMVVSAVVFLGVCSLSIRFVLVSILLCFRSPKEVPFPHHRPR